MEFDALVGVIIVLGCVLLVVTAVMEWVGVLNLLARRGDVHCTECGQARIVRASTHERCWHCRHRRLERNLHIPARHGQ